MTPQRPWWLIYGLSFGVGINLFDIIYFYGIAALYEHVGFAFYVHVGFALNNFINWFLNTFFFLLYFSACLVAGILVARKTRRAGSATLASLLIGLLFILGEFILQGLHGIGLSYILSIDFPVASLGVYVGFLGGLLGRTTEGTRRTIGLFYAVGVILASTEVPFLVAGLFSFYSALLFSARFTMIYVLLLIVLGSLCGMVAWIMTLVQFAQTQSWGSFTLTFFFSGIMVLVYLIVGVPPRQSAQYVALSPGAYPPPVAGVYPPMQPVQAQPPQADAITILQQRFARGEIDAATYKHMRDLLES
jgi:MFS family permease